MNPVYIILFLTFVGALGAHAATTKIAGDKTEIKILNLISVKTIGTEFEFTLEVAADNYSDKSIKINDPVIKIFLGSSTPAVTSVPSDTKYTLEKKKRKKLTLRLRAGFTALPDLFKVIFNKKTSEKDLVIEVSTKANGLPTSDKKTYKINELVKLFKA